MTIHLHFGAHKTASTHLQAILRENGDRLAGAEPRWLRTLVRGQRLLAIGPFLALVVGLGIAFFMESTDHSIRNRADAEEFLEVPVLATITEMKPRKSA